MTNSNDPWVWRAIFADGSTVDEYEASEPAGHGWQVVREHAAQRQTRLVYIWLIPQRAGLASHVVTVGEFANEARIFRRRSVTLDNGSGVEVGERPDPVTVVCVEFAGGLAAYTFVFADGSVVVSDDLNAV